MNDDLSAISCTCAHLRRVSRAFTKAYENALKPSGISSSQFTILNILLEKGPLSINELAASMDIDRTTLSRNLAPMQRDELLTVESEEDLRRKVVSISNLGRAKLDNALPLWQSAQKSVINRLGPQRWHEIQTALNQLRETVP